MISLLKDTRYSLENLRINKKIKKLRFCRKKKRNDTIYTNGGLDIVVNGK